MDSADSPIKTFHRETTQVEVPEYRSLSPLAVVACLLGLLSAACFIGPLLLVIPFAAVTLALIALGKISRAPEHLAGRPLALTGLMLAVALTVASFARLEVRDRIYRTQVQQVAQSWCELMANQEYLDVTRKLTAQAMRGLMPVVPRGDEPPPAEESLAFAIDRLAQGDVARALAGKTGLQLRRIGAPSAPVQDRRDVVVEGLFEFHGPDAASLDSPPRALRMRFRRNESFESEGAPWRIDDWEFVDPPAA
jgi:hypothetical protein